MISRSCVLLSVVIVLVMLTSGCFSAKDSSGPNPLITETVNSAPGAGSISSGNSPGGAPATEACTADTGSDPANCGGCGYVCPVNAICQQGQCFCREGYTADNNACVAAPETDSGTGTGSGCPDGMTPCPDGYCYDLTGSTENCGICGNRCPSGMVCSASACTNIPAEVTTTTITTTTSSSGSGSGSSPAFQKEVKTCLIRGQTKCGGTCVDLMTSEDNCGSCGKTCSGSTPTCCSGACTNLKDDELNCGSCGVECTSSQYCDNGACKTKIIKVAQGSQFVITV